MGALGELTHRRVILITGKGGVGKTTFAAALALKAAAEGKRVCIVESRLDDQIPRIFGQKPHGHETLPVAPQIWSINLDPQLNFRDFVVTHLGFEAIFDRVFNSGIVKSLVRTLPGIAELTLLGRLYYMSELAPDKFDLVIFDGFSSGHFLNLLTTPAAVMRSGLLGPVMDETRKVIDFFNKPKTTGIVFVATAEPLVASECIDFVPRLISSQFSEVAAILINRYVNEQTVAEATKDLSPDLRAYFCGRVSGFADSTRKIVQYVHHELMSSIPILTLQECGAFPEPFTQGFASEWFSQTVELKS